MRWPPWASSSSSSSGTGSNADSSGGSSSNSDESTSLKRRAESWVQSFTGGNWGAAYTDPRNILSAAVLASSVLIPVYVYANFLRRIPGAGDINTKWFRKRSLFGQVTSVGDGDGFHLYHTPGGRLTGWGWFPGRKVPHKRTDLRNRTISVRLAGVDAPEAAHFGRKAQPYADEATTYLRSYVLDRRVRAFIYRRDQYDRVVATVYVRRGLFRRNVGLELLKAGLATVYEAKSGMEFGGLEDKYRAAEAKARRKKKGMWAQKMSEYESPMAYKKRIVEAETTTL